MSGSLQGAGGVGGLLATAQDGAIYFTAFDANGNVCQYIDAGGTTVANREYSPFGKTIALTGAKKDNFTHWFSTKPWDADAEMSEYEYRKYLAEMGRWGSRDEIDEVGFITALPSIISIALIEDNLELEGIKRTLLLAANNARRKGSSTIAIELDEVRHSISWEPNSWLNTHMADEVAADNIQGFVDNNTINAHDILGGEKGGGEYVTVDGKKNNPRRGNKSGKYRSKNGLKKQAGKGLDNSKKSGKAAGKRATKAARAAAAKGLRKGLETGGKLVDVYTYITTLGSAGAFAVCIELKNEYIDCIVSDTCPKARCDALGNAQSLCFEYVGKAADAF